MNKRMSEYKAAKAPCPSCPYRIDTPAGIWSEEEYRKLIGFDGETGYQSHSLFLCHHKNGKLCSGWLQTHNPRELLALRIHGNLVHPSVFDYKTSVKVHVSGQAAHDFGISRIDNPSSDAERKINNLRRMRK